VAGHLIELVAPDSGVTKWEYHPDGQISRVIDPLGRVIEHSYDHLGNLAGMQLPDGSAWSFIHAALSRLTQVVAPDEARWTHAYDVDGNLSGVTDPAGFARPGSLLTVSLPAPPRIVTGTNSTASMPIPTVLLLPSPMSLAPSRSSRVICVADRLSFRTSLAR